MNKYDMTADGEQRLIITVPRETLIRQANEALDAIEAKAAEQGRPYAKLRDGYDIDRDAFRRLIEAMFNLGAEIEPELVELAGLRPIEQVIE